MSAAELLHAALGWWPWRGEFAVKRLIGVGGFFGSRASWRGGRTESQTGWVFFAADRLIGVWFFAVERRIGTDA